MHVLHTARLQLFSEGLPIAVGEAIPAELTIRHTRAWAQSEVRTGSPISFCYELDASPDTWLIGGRRRATFEAEEDEEKAFAVLLLPQRSGQLLLPTLEVSLIEPETGPNATGQDDSQGNQWSCDVDYLSQAEAIAVVPGLKSTAVAMDLEGSQAWLVDVEAVSGSTRAG